MIIEIVYIVLGFFTFFSLIFIILILRQKGVHERKSQKVKQARDYLFKKYIDNEEITLPVTKKFFFDALIEVDEQIHLEKDVRIRIINDFKDTKFIEKQIKRLNSKSKYKRQIAIYYLGRMRTEEIYSLLFERFTVEKNEAIKLNIVAQMRYGLKPDYLPVIIESLINSSDNYHQNLCNLLGNNYKRIYDGFNLWTKDKRFEIVLGLVRIGAFHADSLLVNYMQKTLEWITTGKPFADKKNMLIKEQILKNLLQQTPEILSVTSYLNHTDSMVQEYAISSLSYKPSTPSINLIVDGFGKDSLDETRVKTLSKIIIKDKYFLDHLLGVYQSLNSTQRQKLAVIFSERIDYILLKFNSINQEVLQEIINLILEQRIIEPLIDFLNNNRDQQLEKYLLNLIKIKLSNDEEMTKEFRMYLNSNILVELGLQSLAPVSPNKEKAPVEKKKVYWIIKWLTFSLLLFPIIYLIRLNIKVIGMSFYEIVRGFLIEVNVYLIFYFLAINTVYITLFFFALVGSKKQVNLSKTRKYSLLFSDKLLPGISIIAPAYNEEISIIESVTSLLNLQYPNYEVVVVNDGSKDLTLKKLVEHFDLERKHPTHKTYLETRKIRGIYTCKDIPNLVVVDKQNGGKADALNVGINVSKNPFVCGIDADSILEGDALLKLASAMLDDTRPFVAMGGNIYPANGFKFDKGQVEKRAIPKEVVCRFQTIEYLRAFTSGRIGWSEVRSLMIISGAFGLFKKSALIEGGGYLTSSGTFKKDTVGEDMELVVRLTKQALDKKEPFRVSYVYNAYCYTELPSDLKTLLKQRNRWQRGLIDILSYHRKIALNPKYKQIGFIGYPYFFLFEFLGPFFEAQGYLMLFIALTLGLLNPAIVLGIFTVSIAFGVVISLSSLFMTEREILMMNRKETFILILYAIFENFGYRQIVSLHRVISSLNALKESGKWGTQKRKGFKT